MVSEGSGDDCGDGELVFVVITWGRMFAMQLAGESNIPHATVIWGTLTSQDDQNLHRVEQTETAERITQKKDLGKNQAFNPVHPQLVFWSSENKHDKSSAAV